MQVFSPHQPFLDVPIKGTSSPANSNEQRVAESLLQSRPICSKPEVRHFEWCSRLDHEWIRALCSGWRITSFPGKFPQKEHHSRFQTFPEAINPEISAMFSFQIWSPAHQLLGCLVASVYRKTSLLRNFQNCLNSCTEHASGWYRNYQTIISVTLSSDTDEQVQSSSPQT